jgi:hypothetical protein
MQQLVLIVPGLVVQGRLVKYSSIDMLPHKEIRLLSTLSYIPLNRNPTEIKISLTKMGNVEWKTPANGLMVFLMAPKVTACCLFQFSTIGNEKRSLASNAQLRIELGY